MITERSQDPGEQGDKISVSEGLFYGFYLILTIVKWMGLYEGMRLYTIGVGAAFLFLLSKLVSDRYTLRRLVLTIFTMALGVATWRFSDKMGALFNITLVIGMAGVNRERLLRVTAVSWSTLFALQVFMSLSGIRSTQIIRVHDKLGHYIVRWSMGFTHPNVMHITYYVLLAILIYVYRPSGRRLWYVSIAAMLGNVLIFAYTLSYTGLLITTFYLSLNLLLQYLYTRNRAGSDMHGDDTDEHVPSSRIAMISAMAFSLLCIIFAVAGPLVLRGHLFELVDRALSWRFNLSRQYLLGQQLSLFGTMNMETVDASITIDSSYVYMLMHYGVIYFTLFTVLFMMAVIWYVRRRDYWATAILLACALSGITEQYMANTSFKNIAVLLIGCMIWERVGDDHIARDGQLYIPAFISVWRQCTVTAWQRSWSADLIRRTLAILIIAFVVGTTAYLSLVHRPAAVYASLWDCDRPEGEAGYNYIYYDDLMADPQFDGWILSNRDAEGRLYGFDGFTVDYEYSRRAIGMGVAAVMAVWGVETAVIVYRRRRDTYLLDNTHL